MVCKEKKGNGKKREKNEGKRNNSNRSISILNNEPNINESPVTKKM